MRTFEAIDCRFYLKRRTRFWNGKKWTTKGKPKYFTTLWDAVEARRVVGKADIFTT